MVIGITQAAVNLGTAVAVGAAIAFERQWRQRLAGLRTNIPRGAASFVVFENLFSTDASLTWVAAQVVWVSPDFLDTEVKCDRDLEGLGCEGAALRGSSSWKRRDWCGNGA
jgi:hypothetical protein